MKLSQIKCDKLLLGAKLPCFSKIRLYEEAEFLNVKLISSSKVMSKKLLFLSQALGIGEIVETNGRLDHTWYKLPTQTKVDRLDNYQSGHKKSCHFVI